MTSMIGYSNVFLSVVAVSLSKTVASVGEQCSYCVSLIEALSVSTYWAGHAGPRRANPDQAVQADWPIRGQTSTQQRGFSLNLTE